MKVHWEAGRPSGYRWHTKEMKIKFVAGFSPISPDPHASAVFYADALGIHFDSESGDYRYTKSLGGVKHFSIWSLRDAAMTCFGIDEWPHEFPTPTSTIEFEVDDVAEAEQELIRSGYQMIHTTRVEPWGQTTARLLSPESVLVGIVSSPWFDDAGNRQEYANLALDDAENDDEQGYGHA